MRYLASDGLMGRGVDTPGIDLARDYIAHQFKRYGLMPGGENGGFFQGLNIVTGIEVKEPSSLTLGRDTTLGLNQEWVPLGHSRSAAIEGELVFVGYGITVKDYGYDDYEGVNVKGKIVLVLRYEPPAKNDKSPFRKAPGFSRHATLRAKAANARNHGAIGMILVDLHYIREKGDELIPVRRGLWQTDAGLVAAQVKHEIVERWLKAEGVSLRDLKEKIDREERPASAPLPGLKVSLAVSLDRIAKRTDNVIGLLPGSDPKFRDEHIVVGAHYDHIGLGYIGNRDTSTEGQIHNGADDNASGVAVLLNLAERLSRRAQRPGRTIVFVAFTAEELGAYGSRRYVDHSPLAISSTVAMINFDMVGRMRDNRVTASGLDTAKEFRPWIGAAASALGIGVRPSSGVRRSDHGPFYNKNIPVLHFFTGTHEDYHRPTDKWEKLNVEGMVKISDLVQAVVERISAVEEPPSFVRLPADPGRSEATPTSLPQAPDP